MRKLGEQFIGLVAFVGKEDCHGNLINKKTLEKELTDRVPAGPAAVGEVGFPLEPGQRQSGPAVQRGPAQNVRSRGGAAVGVTAHRRSARTLRLES